MSAGGCERSGARAEPPIRWVSRQQRAWDDDAAWKACLDLLESSDPATFSEPQRTAWLVWRYERAVRQGGHAGFHASTPPALARETRLALRATGNASASDWALDDGAAQRHDLEFAALRPTPLERLRTWCDAYEAYFVREDRPSCSS